MDEKKKSRKSSEAAAIKTKDNARTEQKISRKKRKHEDISFMPDKQTKNKKKKRNVERESSLKTTEMDKLLKTEKKKEKRKGFKTGEIHLPITSRGLELKKYQKERKKYHVGVVDKEKFHDNTNLEPSNEDISRTKEKSSVDGKDDHPKKISIDSKVDHSETICSKSEGKKRQKKDSKKKKVNAFLTEDREIKKKNKEDVNSDSNNIDSSAYQALLYLETWKKNRSEWTFKKVRQVWLLKNMFDQTKIPDKKFKVLLQYLEGLKGSSRETTISMADSVINDAGKDDESDVIFERARRLLQILS